MTPTIIINIGDDILNGEVEPSPTDFDDLPEWGIYAVMIPGEDGDLDTGAVAYAIGRADLVHDNIELYQEDEQGLFLIDKHQYEHSAIVFIRECDIGDSIEMRFCPYV